MARRIGSAILLAAGGLGPPGLVLLRLGSAAGREALVHRPYWLAALGLAGGCAALVGCWVIARAWTRQPMWRLILIAAGLVVLGTYAWVPIMAGEPELAAAEVPHDVQIIPLDAFKKVGGSSEYRSLVWGDDRGLSCLLLATKRETVEGGPGLRTAPMTRYRGPQAWVLVRGRAQAVAPRPVLRRPVPLPTVPCSHRIDETLLLPYRKLGDNCVWGQEHTIILPPGPGHGPRVVEGAGRVDFPEVSPSGQWVVYLVAGWLTHTPRLMVSNASTGASFPVTRQGAEGAYAPPHCFSPDETMLAVWYRRGNRYEACMVVLPGTTHR